MALILAIPSTSSAATATISSPMAGAQVRSSVVVAGEVASKVAPVAVIQVAGASVVVDRTALATTTDTVGNWRISEISSRDLAGGEHSLSVVALDAAGNVGYCKVAIRTDNTVSAPSIIRPGYEQVVGSVFSAAKTAQDASGITQITALIDGIAAPVSRDANQWFTSQLSARQQTVDVCFKQG